MNAPVQPQGLSLVSIIALIRKEIERAKTEGPQGADGKEGAKGPQGPKGNAGPQGKAGPKGGDGKQGKAGKDGKDGKDGEDGADGVGIANIEQDVDNAIVVTMTDGEIYTIEMPLGQNTEVHYKVNGGSGGGGGGTVDLAPYVLRPTSKMSGWLAYREDGNKGEWTPLTTDLVAVNPNQFRDAKGRFAPTPKELEGIDNQRDVNEFLYGKIEEVGGEHGDFASKESLANEADMRRTKDDFLQDQINSNQSQIDQIQEKGYDDTELRKEIADEVAAREKAVEAEKWERSLADIGLRDSLQNEIDILKQYSFSELDDKINIESETRRVADQGLQAEISSLAITLAEESSQRESADTELQGQIDSLEAYDDTEIKEDLSAEITAREEGDANLQDQINAISEKGYDDTEIREGLAAEIGIRESEDKALQKQIEAEKQERSLADIGLRDSLQANIDAIEVPSIEGLATEEYVDSAIEGIEFPETDLTGLATEEYVDGAVSSEADARREADRGIQSEVEDLAETVANLEIPSLDGYATEEYVDGAIDAIEFPETDLSEYAKTEYVDGAVGSEAETRRVADDGLQKEIEALAETVANIDIPDDVDLSGYATEAQLNEVDLTSQMRDEALKAQADEWDVLNTAAHLKLEDQILRYYAWSQGDNEKLENKLTKVDEDLQAQIDELAACEIDLSPVEDRLDDIEAVLPKTPEVIDPVEIGGQALKITGSRPTGAGGEAGKVLMWKAEAGSGGSPYNECKLIVPDTSVIDPNAASVWWKQGDKVQRWDMGGSGWFTSNNVLHYSAAETFGDTLVDGLPIELFYVDPNATSDELLDVISRAESKSDDRKLQVEIEELALALETLLVQREHGQWKYVGFTGDNIPRNAGEFSLAVADIASSQENIITINQEDLKGITHGFGDVEVGDYIEIVNIDEPTSYALFVVTKVPEGTGIVNVEVGLKDTGYNIWNGETCEIRFFAVNEQDLQLEDLDKRYLRKTGGDEMEGPLNVKGDSRGTSRIETLGVFSNSDSGLRLGTTTDRVLIDDDNTKFNGGVLVNNIGPKTTDGRGVTLNVEGSNDKHLVTKSYVDGADAELQSQIDAIDIPDIPDLSDYVSAVDGDQTMKGPLTISGLGTWKGSRIKLDYVTANSDTGAVKLGTPSNEQNLRVYDDYVQITDVPLHLKTIAGWAGGHGTSYTGEYLEPDHIATKKDVEAAVAGGGGGGADLSGLVQKSGDTMTGTLEAPRVNVKKDGEAVSLIEGNVSNTNTAARLTFSNKYNSSAYGSLQWHASSGTNGWFQFTDTVDFSTKGLHSVNNIRLVGNKAIQEAQTTRIQLDNKVVITKVGTNKAGFVLKGGVSGNSNGNLLSVYHNSSGLDSVDYYGKMEGVNNVATVGYVDSKLGGSKGVLVSHMERLYHKDNQTDGKSFYFHNQYGVPTTSMNDFRKFRWKLPSNHYLQGMTGAGRDMGYIVVCNTGGSLLYQCQVKNAEKDGLYITLDLDHDNHYGTSILGNASWFVVHLFSCLRES